jgi:hypothetical protein
MIRMFRALLILLGTVVALPAAAQQVTPESLAASRELMALTRSDQTLDQVISMMLPQISQMLVQSNPEKGPVIESILSEFLLPEMRKSVPGAIDDIAKLYARTFTEAELRDVIAFYKSPTGQKFIERQPALLTELNMAGQKWGERAAINALRNLKPKFKEQGIEVPI